MRDRPGRVVTALLVMVTGGCVYFTPASDRPAGPAGGEANHPTISADGRIVAFASDDPGLVPGDTNGVRDVFVRDLRTGERRRVSVATGGGEANGPSDEPVISPDGRRVAFVSAATNLTPDDTNGVRDVFVHDRLTGVTTRVSRPDPSLVTWATGGVAGSSDRRTTAPETPATPIRAGSGPSTPARPRPTGTAASPTGTGAATRPGEAQAARVLVRLRVAFTPEGRLGDRGQATQRDRIAAVAQRLARRLPPGSRVRHRFTTVPYVAVEVDPAGLAALRRDPDVADVRPDVAVPPLLAETRVLVGAAAAEQRGWTGTGTTVAVLDTGVAADHPALAGRVVSEACYSQQRSCPNGRRTQTGTGAAVPCTYAPSGCAHGTHVASIVAGVAPPARGIAPGATLVAVQVFSRFTGSACAGLGEDPCALSYTSDQLAGLERVYALRATHPIRVVNLSLGGDPQPTPCDDHPLAPMLATLRSVGIATVAAAGNGGDPGRLSAPACAGSAVSVGATTITDTTALFSNGAPGRLTLLAPGVDVTAAVPGGTATLTGTSMAAPHVAGALAVLAQASPGVPLDAMLAWVRATGQPVTDPRTGAVTPRVCLDAALGLGGCHRPANDAFAAAVPLTGTSGVTTGDTLGASVEAGEPDHGGSGAGRSVWYRFRAPATGLLDLDAGASSFPAVVAVYVGGQVDRLVPVATSIGPEGQAGVDGVAVVEGVTYHVAVDGVGGVPGLVVLRHAFTSRARDRVAPAVAWDGGVVAYVTADPGMAAGDTNGVADVFVADRAAGTVTRVSVPSGGGQANGPSGEPSLSADATTVAFTSSATNLVPGDTNGVADVFRRRPVTGNTERVSVPSGGGQANGPSGGPSVSGGGGVVAFVSSATNLVAGDTNGVADAFVRIGTRTRRASVDGGGVAADGPTDTVALSDDRRYVAFRARATNLGGTVGATAGIYVRYAVVPEITAVDPSGRPPGSTATVTITGSGFLAGPAPRVEFGDGVTVTSVSVPSEVTLVVRITVAPDAAPGPRDVVVTNVGTGPGPDATAPGRCAGCFSVTG